MATNQANGFLHDSYVSRSRRAALGRADEDFGKRRAALGRCYPVHDDASPEYRVFPRNKMLAVPGGSYLTIASPSRYPKLRIVMFAFMISGMVAPLARFIIAIKSAFLLVRSAFGLLAAFLARGRLPRRLGHGHGL
jgi:hypothetical protein